jgi:hypothetical protein
MCGIGVMMFGSVAMVLMLALLVLRVMLCTFST